MRKGKKATLLVQQIVSQSKSNTFQFLLYTILILYGMFL